MSKEKNIDKKNDNDQPVLIDKGDYYVIPEEDPLKYLNHDN